jgi:hypothetical protein
MKVTPPIGGIDPFGGSSATGGGASGQLGGDTSGSLPNPTVSGIQGTPVSTATPTDGQVITYVAADGQYEPKTPAGSATPTGPAGGDLGGTYPNPDVEKIDGSPVEIDGTPGTNDALRWNGTAWSQSPGRWEVLMASGITNPPEPVSDTAGDDWLYGFVTP